jgi:hypothetical protein
MVILWAIQQMYDIRAQEHIAQRDAAVINTGERDTTTKYT